VLYFCAKLDKSQSKDRYVRALRVPLKLLKLQNYVKNPEHF
jgi:hypothetical protein